jgi:hypothetical protein
VQLDKNMPSVASYIDPVGPPTGRTLGWMPGVVQPELCTRVGDALD